MWTWRAGGALSLPERAGLWRWRAGDVWPAVVPPASGGPLAGILDPGNSVGSNAAVGICAHSLCADKSAGAAGALWPNRRAFPYP